MTIPAYYMAARPPSIAHAPWLWALAVFGLLGTFLLASEWAWRVAWEMGEEPRPLRHPRTIRRAIKLLLLASFILLIIMPLALAMLWPEVSPLWRFRLADANRGCQGAAVVPFTLAWMLTQFTGAIIDHQLDREPLPVDLWPTWHRLRRMVLIGTLVAAISIGVTVLR